MSMRTRKITTKQVIVAGSLALTILLLLAGLYAPQSLLMSFANVSAADSLVRGLTAIGFITVLATKPPRPMLVRYAFGAISSIILIVACVSMVDYHIGMLDAAMYFLASIILAMEAIEENHQSVRFSSTDKVRTES